VDVAAHHSEGRRDAIEWVMKKRLLIPLAFALAGALSSAVSAAGANSDWALPVGKTLTCPNGFTLTITGRDPDGSLWTKNGSGESGFWSPRPVEQGILYIGDGLGSAILAHRTGWPITVLTPDGEFTNCTLG
jgi:hypothetical protein